MQMVSLISFCLLDINSYLYSNFNPCQNLSILHTLWWACNLPIITVTNFPLIRHWNHDDTRISLLDPQDFIHLYSLTPSGFIPNRHFSRAKLSTSWPYQFYPQFDDSTYIAFYLCSMFLSRIVRRCYKFGHTKTPWM